MPENPARLLGRYALHGEIAIGGMATVHFGRLHGAIGFSRTVAIKRLHKQYARDPDFVSMFLDEARLAARIRHPNVVPTLDVVATEGELFVVMEYVHGESLSRLIREESRQGRFIPPGVVGSILSGTLQGLHAAHEARDERGQPLSIVHRDVSPQNVIVGSDGVTRVLDFGVAKAAGRIHTTRQGQVKGKLPYMAPEQLSAETEVTRLVDVYAASVCLWEALTGRRLFGGDSEAMVLARVLSAVVEPPSQYAPHIPPELDEVVLRGLSRQPATRFTTAREMAIALERAVGRVASSAEVADWMEGVAGAALAARHRTVAEIELQTGKVSSEQLMHEISSMRKAPVPAEAPAAATGMLMTPEPVSVPSGISVQSQVSHFSHWTGAPAVLTRKRKALIAAVVVFAAMLLVLLGVAIDAARRGLVPAASASASAAASQVSPPHPSSPPAGERAGETAVSAPSAASTGSAGVGAAASASASASAADSAGAVESAKVAPKPVGKVAPANNAPAKKSCDPPYSIDANGRKRFKPECL